jgi:hypothetical protein
LPSAFFRGLLASFAAVSMACGGPPNTPSPSAATNIATDEKPAMDPQGADKGDELRVVATGHEAGLEVGRSVEVCVRRIANVFEGGGAFDCIGKVEVVEAPFGPSVRETDVWAAVQKGGFPAEQVAEAYLYAFGEGESPRTGRTSSKELYGRGSEPAKGSFVTAYVLRTSDEALRVFVGVVPAS